MALKFQPQLFHFPFFSKKPHLHHPLPAEVRFSRWNNANADKFTRRQNTQNEIQDQLRFHKRFDSAQSLALNNYNPAPPNPTFKSTGTPSSPSLPSIPGKKSKYSKTPPTKPKLTTHPAFKPPIFKTRRIPIPENLTPKDQNNELEEEEEESSKITPNIQVDEKGVNYHFPDAPFVYQYSYTETPKVKPLGIREPLVAPFEPATMGRPWTGKKPLPPSKKTLPEFDSFKLPPPHKKGVKPVQAPGPYLPGSGPKYVQSREEILGEPLTKEEINDLVDNSRKSTRQLNIGRDGLTHNMLDNIHALWKRKRVCKIKCKGVCTVDMDNVRQQLEEKTGGQVIFSRGGVIFLYRGRNYNYRFRPRFPLMLWKPVTPVYPRLIKRVPEGLTLEQATEMRKKGRTLKPICKLGKNGVYCNLVKNVKEAFEECDLVRINCQGLNGSDYRKIGAKLKELVPCVLISFEEEHILMWRGQNWKSSLPELTNDAQGVEEYKYSSVSGGLALDGESRELTASASSVSDVLASNTHENHSLMISTMGSDEELEESIKHGEEVSGELPSSTVSDTLSPLLDVSDRQGAPSHVNNISDANNLTVATTDGTKESDGSFSCNSEAKAGSFMGSDNQSEIALSISNRVQDTSQERLSINNVWNTLSPSTEGVLLLRKQAVESGSAVVLDGNSLDADLVFQKAVHLSKSAPNGPVYRYRSKKLEIQDSTKQSEEDSEVKEAEKSPEKETSNDLRGVRKTTTTTTTTSGLTTTSGVVSRKDMKKSSKKRSMKDIREDYLNIAPRGTLQVDELAKLLS